MGKYRLFGDCHRFVNDMAEKPGYRNCKIKCIANKKTRCLIHAYFQDENGNCLDSRGGFSNKDEFFAPFTKDKNAEIFEFENPEEFREFIWDLLGEYTMEPWDELDPDGEQVKVPVFWGYSRNNIMEV